MTDSAHITDDQTARTQQEARLNDAARNGTLPKSRIVTTRGVAELLAGDSQNDGVRAANQILNMNRLRRQLTQAPIDPDNDPYGEHDFGAFNFMDQRILWKIDCYVDDGQLQWGSDTPWDEATTCRVMTVMLASEY
jgi:hypothetical protein